MEERIAGSRRRTHLGECFLMRFPLYSKLYRIFALFLGFQSAHSVNCPQSLQILRFLNWP